MMSKVRFGPVHLRKTGPDRQMLRVAETSASLKSGHKQDKSKAVLPRNLAQGFVAKTHE